MIVTSKTTLKALHTRIIKKTSPTNFATNLEVL